MHLRHLGWGPPNDPIGSSPLAHTGVSATMSTRIPRPPYLLSRRPSNDRTSGILLRRSARFATAYGIACTSISSNGCRLQVTSQTTGSMSTGKPSPNASRGLQLSLEVQRRSSLVTRSAARSQPFLLPWHLKALAASCSLERRFVSNRQQVISATLSSRWFRRLYRKQTPFRLAAIAHERSSIARYVHMVEADGRRFQHRRLSRA